MVNAKSFYLQRGAQDLSITAPILTPIEQKQHVELSLLKLKSSILKLIESNGEEHLEYLKYHGKIQKLLSFERVQPYNQLKQQSLNNSKYHTPTKEYFRQHLTAFGHVVANVLDDSFCHWNPLCLLLERIETSITCGYKFTGQHLNLTYDEIHREIGPLDPVFGVINNLFFFNEECTWSHPASAVRRDILKYILVNFVNVELENFVNTSVTWERVNGFYFLQPTYK